jgi:putative hydrolase
MSEFPGGADFFGRIPLFREFARLLAGESGPVNWELARQVAVATAAGADALGTMPQLPRPAPSPPPGERGEWGERLRLAELWVDPATSLAGRGMTLAAQPVSRPDWAEAVLPEFAPFVEPGARRLMDAVGPEATGAAPGEMGEVMTRLGALLAGLQVGALVGQLAQLVFAQYDLGLPNREPARVLVVPENVAEFEQSAGVPADQFRLWLAAHEVVRQRLFASVPWLADHLRSVVVEVAQATDPDPSGLMDRLQSLDLGGSGAEDLRELLEGGQGLLGPPTAALQAATGRLEAALAITEGYALTICERALDGRLPALGAITAAVARRLADPEGPQALFAQLLRIDPERAGAARGHRFCREVLAATDIEGLDRLWAHPDFLPSQEELTVPGRWLERSGLVGGAEVDLDEGLRALLEEDTLKPGDAEDGKPDEPEEGDGKPDGPEPVG